MLIDAQVHVYGPDSAANPWHSPGGGLDSADGDQTVAAMDADGVDRAIIVSSWTRYRGDASYAEGIYRAYPDRFRVVTPINVDAPDMNSRIDQWSDTPGAVGIRLVATGPASADLSGPAVDAAMAAATTLALPVCVMAWDKLDLVSALAVRHPDCQVVVDHVGLAQPAQAPAPSGVFDDLDTLLALAELPNIALKITGACTMSRESFPFRDLWEPVGRIFDTFGMDRCMWGTDWTRTAAVVNHADAVAAFREHWPLSNSDRTAFFAATAARIFHWPMPE